MIYSMRWSDFSKSFSYVVQTKLTQRPNFYQFVVHFLPLQTFRPKFDSLQMFNDFEKCAPTFHLQYHKSNQQIVMGAECNA